MFSPRHNIIRQRRDIVHHHLPQRRDREGAVQKAKDAIRHFCHDCLASSLIDITSSHDRTILVQCCIIAGWISGFNYLISGLPADVAPPDALLFSAVSQLHLDDDTQFKMCSSLIAKGCNVRSSRPVEIPDLGEYEVFKNPTSDVTIYNSRVLDYTSVAGMHVHFVQVLVQNNKWKILSAILHKLGTAIFRLALIEAFGSNEKDCCDVLVNSMSVDHHLYDFAILLATIFGSFSHLETLIAKAKARSADLIKTIKTKKFERINEFSPLTANAPQVQTIFLAAIYFNNPECATILIKNKLHIACSRYDIKRSLHYCNCYNGFVECIKVIITKWDFHSVNEEIDSDLVEVLYASIRNRRGPQIINQLIDKMKTTTGCKKCLNNLLSKCVDSSWYDGLLDLVSSNNFMDTLGFNEEVKDAMKTLDHLIKSNRPSSTINEIIKNLVWPLTAVDLRIDFAPIFEHLLLFNKDAELVKFFLEFYNNKSIMDAATRCYPLIEDENLQQVVDEALKMIPIKEEVVLARVKLEQGDGE